MYNIYLGKICNVCYNKIDEKSIYVEEHNIKGVYIMCQDCIYKVNDELEKKILKDVQMFLDKKIPLDLSNVKDVKIGLYNSKREGKVDEYLNNLYYYVLNDKDSFISKFINMYELKKMFHMDDIITIIKVIKDRMPKVIYKLKKRNNKYVDYYLVLLKYYFTEIYIL